MLHRAALVFVPVLAIAPLTLAQGQAPTTPTTPAPSGTQSAPAPIPEEATGVARLKLEASALAPLVKSGVAKQFLGGVSALPAVAGRQVKFRKQPRTYYTAAEIDALPQAERATLETRTLDEHYFYYTGYGSPLVYARVLELAATCGASPALASLAGKRVMDFGYGSIGQLRLMAGQGAQAVGVDPHPLLKAMYRDPSDQGPCGAAGGSVKLVSDFWPSEASAREAMGGGYDLITSKNTLKMGYIHPSQPIELNQRVDIRVDDAAFVGALFGALKPGGLVVIYNISPAPAKPGENFKPWAEGTTPFKRETWEGAGFKVLALDQVDDGAAIAIFKALGFPTTDKDGGQDIFAHYTIAQRPE